MQVDREGTFIADIYEYGLHEADSGAVGVNLKARLIDIWDEVNKEWVSWTEYEQEAEGCIWIVKKDKTANQKGAESLIRHAGWDGKCSTIIAGYWETTRCQVVIKADNYNDEKRFRIAFVNAFNATPGGGGNVDQDKAKALDVQYGSTFRALAGNAALNQPKQQANRKDRPASPSRLQGTDEVNRALAEAADDKIPY
jgi:hypothetical protein